MLVGTLWCYVTALQGRRVHGRDLESHVSLYFTSITSAVCLVKLHVRGGWFAYWMQRSWGAQDCLQSMWCLWVLHMDAGVSWELDGDVGSSLLAVR